MEETLVANKTTTLDALKRMMRVSTRLRLDMMRNALKLDQAEFDEKIFAWADEFGFTIDGDYVSFSAAGATDFISELEREFANWGAIERTTGGKIEQRGSSGPVAGSPPPSTPTPRPPAMPPRAETGDHEYNGIILTGIEHTVMVTLETACGTPIPAVTGVQWNTFGFATRASHVTDLGIHKQPLRSLPETIVHLTSLQTLYLSSNQLPNFPEIITKMPWLRALDLSGNQIPALPETIGSLNLLTSLELGGTGLASLPKTIGNLTSLKGLSLYNNKLLALPETLGNLSSLEDLSLNNNQLDTLPGTLNGLISLKKLYLNGNQLVALPETLSNLTQLETLWVDKSLERDRVVKVLQEAGTTVAFK